MPDADLTPTPDSSSVPVPALLPVERLDAPQRAEWLKTGERPTAASASEVPDASADSSPAVPNASAAETAVSTPPASEPGTPTRKPNAESRKAQLSAEIQDLLRQRALLQHEITQARPTPSPDASAASSPAPLDFPPFEQWLGQPGNEGQDYDTYRDHREDFRQGRSAAVSAQVQAKASRHQAFVQRVATAATADPEWTNKVHPHLLGMRTVDSLAPGEEMTAAHVLAQEIYESDAPVAVLQHLTQHPEDIHRLLTAPTFAAIARSVGALATRLTHNSSASTVPSVPTVKTTTDAPPPPPTLGSRPHTPEDEVLAAHRSGDFRRFRDAANARDIARMKAGTR